VIGLLGLVVGPVLVILTGHGGGLAERIALSADHLADRFRVRDPH
jgi:hypothetical protein